MTMKHSILLFIFIGYSFFSNNLFAQKPDSLELFQQITDIEKQMQNSDKKFHQQHSEQAISGSVPQTPQQRRAIKDSLQSIKNMSSMIVKTYLDSMYVRNLNGTLRLPDFTYDTEALQGMTFRDTVFYNTLYLPVIFRGRRFVTDTTLIYPPLADTNRLQGLLISPDETFAPRLAHEVFVDKVLDQYYKDHPTQIRASILDVMQAPKTATDKEVIKEFNPFKELISVESDFTLAAPNVEKLAVKRRYWDYSGNHSFQFSQTYFSPNWYKGGKSNLNILSAQNIKMNYNKNKLHFSNSLDWRLSLNNAPDDTLRSFRIGEDLLRYYGTLSVDAFLKKWAYSTNMEIRTQLFPNFPANSSDKISSFISPMYINAGIGMKYSYNRASKSVKNRNFNVSLDLSPLSINFRHVGSNSINVTRYGIPAGKKSLTDYGSTVTANMGYNYNKYISLTSRFKYFTSYKKIETELENNLNVALSNYFSTRIFLYLRFDDSVPSDPKFKKLQVNELLSFGLNYKW